MTNGTEESYKPARGLRLDLDFDEAMRRVSKINPSKQAIEKNRQGQKIN